MNKRFVSVLIFALIVSGVASLLVYRLIASRLSGEGKPVVNQIVVASRTLEVGTLIREPDMKVAEWPGAVPPNAILKSEEIVGRGVIANIYQGEPILETRLAPKGAGAGLAATIPAGMRAVAVRVNDVVGVAGFVVPGMRVDLLISGLPPNSPPGLGTLGRTLLQNIAVLSAGTNIQKDAEGKPIAVQVVNLLATPEQAEILSLASSETRIQFVLRNPLDTEIAKTPGTAVAKLFGTAPGAPKPAPAPKYVAAPVAKVVPPPPPRPAPEPLVVEVIHGTAKAQTKFQQAAEARP